MQQPTRLISTPFAQEGEKTDIQNVTGESDNSATYRVGFPPITMQSIRLGGKPPKGMDFNGVLFDITENISFLCKGGRYQYSAGLSTLIGGYPEGSNLLLDDNITEVVSEIASNQNNPNTNMTGWKLKPTKASSVLSDGDQNQQQINDFGGAKWYAKSGGYQLGATVKLDNGETVKSTVVNNTNDPNIDMTGWFNPKSYQENLNLSIINYVNPKMWGAVGDGIADDSSAIESCRNYMIANAATFNDFSESKYRHTRNITFTAPNQKIIINGNCEFVSDNNYITFSGTNEQIGYVASAATKGSRTITLNTSASLTPNDLIAIHNSRTSSLSTHQPYYHDGEYKIVESSSATTITLLSQLETSYPSGIDDKVWKINPITLNIIGVKFTGNGFTALRILLGRECTGSFTTENLNNSATSQNSFILEKCFSCEFTGGRYVKVGLSGSGTDYGVAVSNCQDVLFLGGYAYGGRHATAIGGGSGDMTVPSRRVRYEGMTIENNPASSLHAADMHGNAIDCHYKNNNILGRITLSGKNPSVIGNTVTAHEGDIRPPIGLSEIVGGVAKILNNEILSTGAASFVVGWLSSNTILKITERFDVNIQDIEFAGNVNLLGIYPIFNMPTVNNVVIDGFNLVGDAPDFDRLTSYSAGASAIQPSYIQITRPKFAVPENVSLIASGATLTNTIKNVFSSSGTNANGTWIKNSDGSMICTHRLSATVPINTAYAGGFKSSDIRWTFPKAFVGSVPRVVGTNKDNSCISSKDTGATLIQSDVFGVALTSFASAGVVIDVVAFGRHLP